MRKCGKERYYAKISSVARLRDQAGLFSFHPVSDLRSGHVCMGFRLSLYISFPVKLRLLLYDRGRHCFGRLPSGRNFSGGHDPHLQVTFLHKRPNARQKGVRSFTFTWWADGQRRYSYPPGFPPRSFPCGPAQCPRQWTVQVRSCGSCFWRHPRGKTS